MSTGRVLAGLLLGAVVGVGAMNAAEAAGPGEGRLPVRLGSEKVEAYVHSRVLDGVQETGEQRVIVVMGDPSLAEARAQDWRRRGPAIAELGRRVMSAAPSFRVTKRYRIFPFLAGRADEAALRELAGCAFVEGVYPDRQLKAALAESGPLIGQPTVEAANHKGQEVGIAVVDTGIDYTHSDLDGGRVVAGYNFLAGDPDFPQYTDPNDYMDDEGHGTFVAGIAAGDGTTYRGIAPAADLIALKVLDDTGIGYGQHVMDAIEWCIANKATYNIRVINLSLSDGAEWTDPEECAADPEGQVIADAVDAGIVVVAAAGNEEYLGGVGIPACSPDAIAVGATYDEAFSSVAWGTCSDSAPGADDICCFSNRGELLDMWAPGGVITSAKLGGSYVDSGGTSASAPHVAGAAAVLFEIIGGGATAQQVRQRLTRTGVPIVDPVTDVGTPRIDLVRAMNNTPTSGPDLVVTAVQAEANDGMVGDSVGVSLTVENQGNAASGACTALVVLSANNVVSPQDTVMASVAIPGLAAGGSHPSGTVSGTIPAMNSGEYVVGGYVDSGYAVTEKDETNNGRPGPGFSVGASSYVIENNIPASMMKGEAYTISVTMWNDGTSDWTTADAFALRAVSPEGTGRWGISTVGLPDGQTVEAGATVKFEMEVTAPIAPGLYPCHWRMAKGSRYFGEMATGATKVRPDNDPLYSQESAAIGGDWAAYMDYGGLYRDYGVSAISVNHLPTGSVMTLPDDIPFPRDAEWAPYPPYEYFDISWHYLPEISGSWVTWVVDDRPENKTDPWDSYWWYFQITAYNVQSAGVLPLRIVYDDWDALFPAIDGNLVVWEDYRNDPDRLWGWFLDDNSDIYIYDIQAGESYPLCEAAGPQLAPRISGDLVAWEDWRDLAGMQSDIYVYDLSVDTDGDGTPNWKDDDRPYPDPAESMVTDTWWSEQYPDISGRRIVWLDLRRDAGMGTTVDVYLRDLDGPTEAAVATDPAAPRLQPRIDGTQVTWMDWREGNWDVYWMNVATGAEGPIAGSTPNEFFSDISGDRVIYQKDRATFGEPPYEWDVYNVWVQEMLQEGSVGTHTFTDVPSTYWSWWEVEQAAANGVVHGYGDTYQPSWIVSRDQMAVYVARALAGGDEYVPTGPPSPSFSDVPNTGSGDDGTEPYWAYRYIEYCADPAQGVVEGYPGGEYRPSQAVTRDQMGVFMARARGWVALGDEMDTAPELFPDVLAGFWAGTAIEACVNNGVVSGYPDGRYHPEYLCSRDQVAVYVSRAFDYQATW